MDVVIVNIVTRNGENQVFERNCGYKTTCSLHIIISEDMKPHSTVIVYFIKNQYQIFKGQTEIRFEKLSNNFLSTLNLKLNSKP